MESRLRGATACQTAATNAQTLMAPIRHRSTALKSDETFEGYLSSFIPDGLILYVNATTEYDVIVDGGTEFDGFTVLTDLTIGDFLEVRGQVNGSTIIAERIRLRDDGGETTLEGAITKFHLEWIRPRCRLDDLRSRDHARDPVFRISGRFPIFRSVMTSKQKAISRGPPSRRRRSS